MASLPTVCPIETIQDVPEPDTMNVPGSTAAPNTHCPAAMPVPLDTVSVVPEIDPVVLAAGEAFVPTLIEMTCAHDPRSATAA